MIEKLKSSDADLYIDFISDVFDYRPSKQNVQKYIKENIVLIIKRDEKIVASVSIKEENEYIKDQKYYYINYLGVLKEYRREGFATMLFDEIDIMASENNIKYLLLTSGNQRKSAHYFYKYNCIHKII